MNLLVRQAGFLTSVQDLGRTGYRESGVSVGGALDPHALKVANLLVGNEPGAAGLELTAGKLRLQASDDRLVAWCGGDFLVETAEATLRPGHVIELRAGEEMRITARAGRAWLAISGGIDVPPVLGSRSTDLRSGFGGFEGRALRDGDVLPLGSPHRRGRCGSFSAPNEWSSTRRARSLLRVLPGAQDPEFPPAVLTRQVFTVTQDSNRMGVRLSGAMLKRSNDKDLISQAVAPGTIQVPPGGQPILLLGDCQTIGGYPKLAHVITVDLSAAAQLWPGDEVRFMKVSIEEAHELLRERENDLQLFGLGLELQAP